VALVELDDKLLELGIRIKGVLPSIVNGSVAEITRELSFSTGQISNDTRVEDANEERSCTGISLKAVKPLRISYQQSVFQ
jgi:hypothetical protein